MKSFLSFGIVLVVVQWVSCGGEMSPEQKEIMEKCKAETKFEGTIMSIGEDAGKDAKCFLACMMKSGEEVNKDGTFNIDKIKERIKSCKMSTDEQKEKFLKGAEECVKEVKPVEEPCQNAFNFNMCMKLKKGPK